jgi:histone H2A
MSRTHAAGLIFSVRATQHAIRRQIKRRTQVRVGCGAAIYLAGAIEYLASEMLELASNAAHSNRRTRITPRHVQLAIRNDDELNKLCAGVTIATGGVTPNIHAVSLPRSAMNSAPHLTVSATPRAPESPSVRAFKSNIYRVLQKIRPGMGISKKAIQILCCMLLDIRSRIIGAAGYVMRSFNTTVLASREIQNGLRLCLPGELAKHGVSEGTRAVIQYTNHKNVRVSSNEEPFTILSHVHDMVVHAANIAQAECCKISKM